MSTGDALFMQSDSVSLHAGSTGLVGLVAYTGDDPVPILLRRARQPGATHRRPPQPTRAPPLVPRAKTTRSPSSSLDGSPGFGDWCRRNDEPRSHL
jgi:hypothetical protein